MPSTKSVLAPAVWLPGGILACGSLLGCPLVTPAASQLLRNAGVSRHGRSDGCARLGDSSPGLTTQPGRRP